MSTPINVKTFLIGDDPKNAPLSITEMDQNLINLKGAIQSVEDTLGTSITDAINSEEAARIAGDDDERALRIAADNDINSRLTPIENSYLKKDGSIAMVGNLNLGTKKLVNVGKPTAGTDGANKDYVDQLAIFSKFIDITANLTITNVTYTTYAGALVTLASSAAATITVTLPNPSAVPQGTMIAFKNKHTTYSLRISAEPGANITYADGTNRLFVVMAYEECAYYIVVGTKWVYAPVPHFTAAGSRFNNGYLRVTTSGSTDLGKQIDLHYDSTDVTDFNARISIGSTYEVDINSLATADKLLTVSNSGVVSLTLKNDGKLISNANPAITDSNQFVTKGHIDSKVTALSGVLTKVVPLANIKTNKDETKPNYPGLVASDFGNVIRYRMDSLGSCVTTLPDISTLTGSKRINLINISNDTLGNPGGVVPGYAITALVGIFPSAGNKIVGLAGSVFTSNGYVPLDAGDTAELIAINSTEWMLISHSSINLGARLAILPHNTMMIHCGVNSNGTMASQIVNSPAGPVNRNYLWTKPNYSVGNGSGIIVSTSRASTGVYNISWLNPNCWENGQTYIVQPTTHVTVNFSGGDGVNSSYTTKVTNLPGGSNGCTVIIKDHNNNFVDAPFIFTVYGLDV